jgi:hypothetical protein
MATMDASSQRYLNLNLTRNLNLQLDKPIRFKNSQSDANHEQTRTSSQ